MNWHKFPKLVKIKTIKLFLKNLLLIKYFLTMDNTVCIILAGGSGTRLFPITKSVNKHLLPIYDMPLIYYPFSILLNSGYKEFIIVTNKDHIQSFKKLFNFSKKLNISIKFSIQKKPEGIAQALRLQIKKIKKGNDILLFLGDNIFKSNTIINSLKKSKSSDKGLIFIKEVHDPGRFGVYNKEKNNIIEKPKKFISKYAVTGIYKYKYEYLKYLYSLKKSKRGEFEITDFNNILLSKKYLNIVKLKKNDYWLDTGTFNGLLQASNFAKNNNKYFKRISPKD